MKDHTIEVTEKKSTVYVETSGGPQGPQGLQGPIGLQGPPGKDGTDGPTAVSSDLGNIAKLGSDGLLFVPSQLNPGIDDEFTSLGFRWVDNIQLSAWVAEQKFDGIEFRCTSTTDSREGNLQSKDAFYIYPGQVIEGYVRTTLLAGLNPMVRPDLFLSTSETGFPQAFDPHSTVLYGTWDSVNVPVGQTENIPFRFVVPASITPPAGRGTPLRAALAVNTQYIGAGAAPTVKFTRVAFGVPQSPPEILLRGVGTQALPVTNTFYDITFWAPFYQDPTWPDMWNQFDPMNVTIPMDGTYLLQGKLDFYNTNGTGHRVFRFLINGNGDDQIGEFMTAAATGAQPVVSGSALVRLKAGDKVRMQGWQGSGVASGVNGYSSSWHMSTFQVRLVSGETTVVRQVSYEQPPTPAPYVRAESGRGSVFQAGTWMKVPLQTLKHNVGGFSIVNGSLVVPQAGRYLLSGRVFTSSGVGLITSLQIDPTPSGEAGYGSSPMWWTEGAPAGSATHTSGGRIFDLAAGASVSMYVYNRGATSTADGWVELTAVALDGYQRELRHITVEQPFAPDTSWRTAVLENGWVNYGESYGVTRYRKHANGQVEIQGIVKNGTAPTIFTLPVGYRPNQDLILAGVQHPNAFARFTVQGNGTVRAEAGYYSTTWFTLNCTFYAD